MNQTSGLFASCLVLFFAAGTMAAVFGSKKEEDKKNAYGTFEDKKDQPGLKDKVKDMFGMKDENKETRDVKKTTTTSTAGRDKMYDEKKQDARWKSTDAQGKDTTDKIHETVKDTSGSLNEKVKGVSEFMDEKVKDASDFVDEKVQDASDYLHEKVKSDKREDDYKKTDYAADYNQKRQAHVNDYAKRESEPMKDVQGKIFEKDASGNIHERDTAGKLYEDKKVIQEKEFRSNLLTRAWEKIKDVLDPQDGSIDIYGRQITYKITSHSHLLSSKSYDCSMTDVPTKITVESKNWKNPKDAFEHALDDEMLPKLKQRGVIV
jgi:hypothetical protein